MKKVLYVATIDDHIRAFHLPYLKLLHDNGYEVHVATNGKEQFSNCDVKHQICIERSPLSLKNIKAIRELKKIIEKEKYDIVHCHTPMGSVVARLAARGARKKYGTRVIYTAHGFHFYKGAPKVNWMLFYPIEKWLAKYTDTLITINKEDYELAKKKFSKRVIDIRIIPGIGVDEKKYDYLLGDTKTIKLQKEFGINKNSFVLIYPARLCKEKNQKLLLDFMKKVNNDNLILLLPGSDESNGFYEKYISDNNLKNIKLLGKRKDVSDLLKISDLLIASSIREGFGINLVEALVSKIPIIAVDNRGHREIVIDGINGYIIKNSVDDLIEKFNKIYNNKSRYEKMKANCYECAKKFFLSNSLSEMKKIYNL